ncbi:TPA: carbon monoxide dehydrogenase [bacterium]|nr:carbon monoxide dehydrogenase [bacterium]
MGRVIAIAGKGGVGKTTIAGFIIRYLKERSFVPILAVDADPSTNLNITLGMEVNETIGSIREKARSPEIRDEPFVNYLALIDYLELMTNYALVEGEGIDLIAMGRVEGKGCYCAANASLRDILKRLSSNYRYVVIDNEAGLEHISRQADGKVDVMFIISDLTQKGLMTVFRINSLIKELENEVEKTFLILNKVKGEVPPSIPQIIHDQGLTLGGRIMEDPSFFEYELSKGSIFDIKEDTTSYRDISQILENVNKICGLW